MPERRDLHEVERRLEALRHDVDWPSTPTFDVPPSPDALAAPPRRLRLRGRRRTWALVLAALALAVAVAMAVPGARSAILDWLRLGGVRIERVETTGPTPARPLGTHHGPIIGRGEATRILGVALRLPRAARDGPLRARDGVVSVVFRSASGSVLLSASHSGGGPLFFKQLPPRTTWEYVETSAGRPGAWISGAEHVVFVRQAPARLAGNALIWLVGSVTYRLEGPALARDEAIALARAVTP